MNFSSVINSAVVFAAKKDVRYYLNGINIYHNNETVTAIAATDGHCMQLITTSEARECGIKDSKGSFIVNLKDCKRISAIFDGYDISDVSVDDILKNITPVEGNYPDITKVIPDKEVMSESLDIGINYKYLAKISQSMAKLSKGLTVKLPYARFRFNGPDTMIRIDVDSPLYEDINVITVIMPVRL